MDCLEACDISSDGIPDGFIPIPFSAGNLLRYLWMDLFSMRKYTKQTSEKDEKNGRETPFSQEKSWGKKKEKAATGALRGRTLVILSADKPKEAKSRNFSAQSWKICENYEGL